MKKKLILFAYFFRATKKYTNLIELFEERKKTTENLFVVQKKKY
jgi:hypothetical protein